MNDSPQKAMRKSYSRCGWAMLALTGVSFLLSLTLSIFTEIPALQGTLVPLFDEYALYLNEAMIAVAMLVGFLVLITAPKRAPKRTKTRISFILSIFAIAVTASSLGNAMGRIWRFPFDSFFGSGELESGITELLLGQGPLQMILCVGILAPIFEEFFFRKLLIDCLYPHGEFLAILTSGFLFALFHQNIEQYFYTFGVGILFAFLYTKTGSYLAVTLMHAAFNLFLGVFPALAAEGVTAFVDALDKIPSEEMFPAITALLAEHWLSLLYYGVHLLLVSAFTVTGIVLFLLKVKTVRVAPPPAELSAKDMAVNGYVNVGMLLAIIPLIGATVLSLFA